MKNRVSLFSAALLSLFLAGCAATQMMPVTFIPRDSHPVKTIALVRPISPKQIEVLRDDFAYTASGSRVLGMLPILAIGAATTSASREHTAAFAKSIEGLPFNVGQIMTDAISKNLSAAGYIVTVVDHPKADANSFLANYDLGVKADAYLDTSFHFVGLRWGPGGDAYAPEVIMSARLVVPKDRTVLYYQDILYRGEEKPEYAFNDNPTIIQNKDRALEGLSTSLIGAASVIGVNLNEASPIVYVDWPLQFALTHPGTVSVAIGGQHIDASLGRCKALRITPGQHEISSKTLVGNFQADPLFLKAESGKTYYLKVITGMFIGFKLIAVSEQEVSECIARCKTAPQKLED